MKTRKFTLEEMQDEQVLGRWQAKQLFRTLFQSNKEARYIINQTEPILLGGRYYFCFVIMRTHTFDCQKKELVELSIGEQVNTRKTGRYRSYRYLKNRGSLL